MIKNEHSGFPPVVNNNSKILILGSFPSVKSREECFYYGNPMNRFWKMLSQIYKENFLVETAQKQNLILKHNLALWDVVSFCNIVGSSDSKLSSVQKTNIAPIEQLLQEYPSIQKILCNGAMSYKLLLKFVKIPPNIQIFCLPSTSPANTRFDISLWEKELKQQ